MVKLTKNRKSSLEKYDKEKLYSLKEASDIIKSFSNLKFDSSVDLALNLGVDPKKQIKMLEELLVFQTGQVKMLKF